MVFARPGAGATSRSLHCARHRRTIARARPGLSRGRREKPEPLPGP
jgi:hypothetical protein